VQYCFGMCKMTNIFERDKKASPSSLEIDFVEFLEFLCRIAFIKFQGSELEETLTLDNKIEYVLDDLLPLIG